jgi:7-keto-8-aminopelargonate synthetase-like enzyme
MINNWQQNRIIHSKEYQVKASLEVNELIFTSKKDKVITLVDGTTLIEFVSCSYLGLDTHPKILNAIKKILIAMA